MGAFMSQPRRDVESSDAAALAELQAQLHAAREQAARARAEGIAAGRAEGIAAGRTEGAAVGRAEGIAAGRAEGIAAGRAESAAALQAARRAIRIGQLRAATTINIPNVLNSDRKLSRLQPLPNVLVKQAWETFELPPVPNEASICLQALEIIRGVDISKLRGSANEIRDVHPFVKQLLRAVATAAREYAEPSSYARPAGSSLKSYHERKAAGSSDMERPDFTFTAAHEQVRAHANTCTMMEVKPFSRADTSCFVLGREAVAKCVHYLAERHIGCDLQTTRGIACVSVGGDNLVIVDVNFLDDDMPVRVSSALPLLRDAGAESSTIPDGMLALVRLMCATDPLALFGLQHVAFQLQEADQHHFRGAPVLLGCGGFSNVVQLTHAETSTQAVCKYPRHRELADLHAALEAERQVLLLLNPPAHPARVPHVPQVCTNWTSFPDGWLIGQGGVRALLMTPVGRPVWCVLPEEVRNAEQRRHVAILVLEHVWVALASAHACGFLHCDVRPSNVVLVGEEEAFLIDWGLAVAMNRTCPEMFGEWAFFSDRQLLLLQRQLDTPAKERSQSWTPIEADDLSAAVYTFFAIIASDACGSPWVADWLQTPESLRTERATWVVENAAMLRMAASFIRLEAARDAVLSVVAASEAAVAV